MSRMKDQLQTNSANLNQNQNQMSSNRSQPRLEFRASCDPCAASKVRCTKEQHGCSRCVQNGLKCVYGRSRRKGKPPSNKFSFTQSTSRDSHRLSPPTSVSPQARPVAPPPSSSWAAGQHPNQHQSNYNYNCTWSRSPMFPTDSYQDQALNNTMTTEWERRTPNSFTPHQSLPDDNSAPQLASNSGYMSWHNISGADIMVADGGDFGSLPMKISPEEHGNSSYDDGGDEDDERDEELEEIEDVNEDQHEPCITVACRLLSSLSQFVHWDCRNGHISNDGGASDSHDQHKTLTPEEEAPPSDIVFRMTQSATDNVSRLLNCTGSACAQDASTLLVLSAVLSKILTWYQALYHSEIGRQLTSVPRTQPGTNPTRLPAKSHISSSSWTGNQLKPSRQVGGTADSLYAVPLTIPLSIGNFSIPRATERKMKAQLLLCQLQSLFPVCQDLDRRAQGADSMRGGKKMWEGTNAQLLEQVAELQRILTVICTQVPTK
ncbi:transcriptional regulator family: Fungal Specific TF [Penicillium sp. IBT 35674x]|nr:transcriptional regulator family: Fungal Specific TF [Penicillium sp. IBT 35674x]